MDEFAMIENGMATMGSVGQATKTAILNSTARTGSAYNQIFKEIKKGQRPKFRIVEMPYYDHPEKGVGREWKLDEDGSVTFRPGSWYYDTPWLQNELLTLNDKAEIAAEIFRDKDLAGQLYFKSEVLTYAEARVRPHNEQGSVEMDELKQRPYWRDDINGKWRLWRPLQEGHPRRDTNYVLGIDFSQGVGKSNSIILVMDASTGEVVAEYANPNIAPHDMAVLAYAAGKFWGGACGHAFIAWETTGPGMGFTSAIRDLNYPLLYRERPVGKKTTKRSQDYGWNNNAKTKEFLFSDLHKALQAGEVTIYQEDVASELWDYMFDDRGRIVAGSKQDETTGALARHGDRVIALGLCQLARQEAPRFIPPEPRFKANSLAHLMGHKQVWENIEDA
jgi:hypothetical protein